jgi:VWFA-related protein
MRLTFPLCLLLLLALQLPQYVPAQTRKKPKLKDFGQSLKKLKWDPERNTVVETTDSQNTSSDDDDVIRIETTLVSCSVLVVDKAGKIVQGLKQEDFEVSEDDKAQQVGHFVLGDSANLPRSIVLIIDYSGSQLPYIRNSVEAAKVLVDKLSPADQMAIVTDDVELLVEFTSDKGKLKKELDSLVKKNEGSKGFLGLGQSQRFGRSAQYSALMATLKEAFDNEDERPIIIFQTDGDEVTHLRNSIIVPRVPPGLPLELRARAQEEVELRLKLLRESMTEFSLEDVYREVEKSRATIYTVIPGFKLIDLPLDEQIRRLRAEDEKRFEIVLASMRKKLRETFKERQAERDRMLTREIWEERVDEAVKIQGALAGVAPISGGWTEFLERPEQADSIYSRIFADINQRYIVGYYPTNKLRDGTRRKINVRVKNHPEYNVLGRRWYYAPAK